MFLMMIQWLTSLYPWQISSWLFFFVFGPGPVLCCFAVLLFGENANLAGGFAGRFWLRFLVCVEVMICPRFLDHTSLFLNAFHRLRYCKDRA